MIVEQLWDPATNEVVRDVAGSTVPLFEALTHLGDGALLLVAGVLLYWFGAEDTRRNRAFVIAVGTAALALSAGLKGIVQMPRPALAFTPVGYPGYSFPSAHAMGSAAFYAALAVSMKRGERWMRYLLAGTIVATVSLSRVVLGLHYLGDVLVGIALGFGLVVVGIWIRDEGMFDPGPIFVLATAIAAVAALLGSRVFLTLTLGASIGGTIGWYYSRDRPGTDMGAAILVLGVAGLAGIIALRGFSAWVGPPAPPDTFSTVLPIVEVIGYAALTVLVLAVPNLAIRIENRPTVRWIQATLPFRGRVIEPEEVPSGDD